MADPRFYDNRGPFTLAEVCAAAGLALPERADPKARIFDVAGLAEAGPQHLSFYAGSRARNAWRSTRAGWCIAGKGESPREDTIVLTATSVPHAFAAAARLFYPEHELDVRAQDANVHESATLGENVV